MSPPVFGTSNNGGDLTTAAEPIADVSPAIDRAIKDWANDQTVSTSAMSDLHSALSDEQTRVKLRKRVIKMKKQYPGYDPLLLLMLYGSNNPRVDIMVKYRDASNPSILSNQLSSLDDETKSKYVFEDINVISLHNVKKSDVKRIGESKQVKKVYLVQQYSIPEPQPVSPSQETGSDRDVAAIDASSLWAKGIKGQGIRIAVLDTGIDDDHPDLDDIPATGESKIVAEEVFVSPTYTSDPTDDAQGHGTHVAGIIAGTGEASNGQYKGIAPRAKLLNAKVANKDADVSEDDVIAAIEWSMNHNADIISMSLKFNSDRLGESPLSLKVDQAVENGVYVSIAVGNEGKPMWDYFR